MTTFWLILIIANAFSLVGILRFDHSDSPLWFCSAVGLTCLALGLLIGGAP